MADLDDMEIDPAIAEAMGFAGFGGKKRKQTAADEAFVDPTLSKHAKGSEAPGRGANTTALGNRPSSSFPTSAQESGKPDATTAPDPGGRPSNENLPASSQDDAAKLQALRQGVRNERGDMVYFLPSFLEDPWKNLSQ